METMFQRINKKYGGVFLAFVLMFLLIPNVVKADGLKTGAAKAETRGAEEYSCTVYIPVRVDVQGNTSQADENLEDGTYPNEAQAEYFTVAIGPAEEDVPMPEQTETAIRGGESARLGPVTYTAPGDYKYRIVQRAGTKDGFVYDKTAYTVTVRVTNDGAGGLTAELWAIEDGTQNKTDEIRFVNKWEDPARQESAAPEASEKGNVKTGDAAGLAVPFVSAFLSVMIIAATYRKRKCRTQFSSYWK